MKVLCLHGAFSNSSNFEIQLLPFAEAVSLSGEVEFKWNNGGYDAKPPPGYEDYFGAPPLYRNIDTPIGQSQYDDMLWRIRDLSVENSPEDSIRKFIVGQKPMEARYIKAAMARLLDIIEKDPEIDGILGYSEGAMVASSLLLEEGRIFREEGRPRRLQYGIFFGGWPPLVPKGDDAELQLSDESDAIIDVPTLHVIGCNDPYLHGALALYSLCDEDTAVMFDHGKGHTVPRDARTIEELAVTFHGMRKGREIRV